ncbi:Gfo/Idh/MocA family protein [Angustibacter sp. McL0619]|uniref:Gfo/Idh/MocA family protein n=1 Tax=Angustibacter sp. McL0619 TaxID=3415676 RepID=UPI003CECBFDB
MTRTAPIGVAVIGAGMAGRSHAHAYRTAQTVFGSDAPDTRLVAVADVNETFARHTQERYGFERTETSWEAVAEADDIDAVSIVVANGLHREIAEALLASGKHVLCEKPLASSVADAKAMVDAAERAPELVTATGFSYRRAPAIAAIAEQIRSGAIGELLSFNGRYWCDYGANPDSPTSWRYTGPVGSGALADIGSHLIDTAEQLCGPIVRVTGALLPTVIKDRPVPLGAALGHAATAVSDVREPVTNDDLATFVVEFGNGGAGTFSISRVAVGHANTLGLEVFGTTGAASFDLSANAEFGFVDNGPEPATNGWRRVLVGPDHPYVAAGQSMPFAGVGHGGQDFFTYQARAFLDEIAGLSRLPRPATFADGLRNLVVEEAVIRSCQSGESVEISA